MMATSSLNLIDGTFQQSNGITTNLTGTATVGAGSSKFLGGTKGGVNFQATNSTTLTGTLEIDCPKTDFSHG